MKIWNVDKEVVVTRTFQIYRVISNFLTYDLRLGTLENESVVGCGICEKPFVENEKMTLALNAGEDGNLFICHACKDEAVNQGVHCTEFKKKENTQ